MERLGGVRGKSSNRDQTPRFAEPGAQVVTEDGFSMYLETGPFHFGTPDAYARGKAREFPDEGGAVILILEVPDEIVQKAATPWFPLSQGLVQFDPGSGLEELVAAWARIAPTAQIRSVI
jgi:hypothetical protein